MKLWIIRHGDPDYANDCLTEAGTREAALLARRTEAMPIDALYVSPLGRARATCAPTEAARGQTAAVLDWLREYPAHIRTAYRPDGMCPWELRPSQLVTEPGLYGLDTWQQTSPFADSEVPAVYARVTAALDDLIGHMGYRREGRGYRRLTSCEDKTAAFFCHQGLGMALISHLLSLPLAQMWQTLFLPTSSVTEIEMRHLAGEDMAAPFARYIGDTSHLYMGNAT